MSDENYIDKLYKDAFKSYEIQPKKDLNLSEHIPEEVTAEEKEAYIKRMDKQWLIKLCVIGVALIFAFIFFTPSHDETTIQPIEPSLQFLNEFVPDSSLIETDTSTYAKPDPVEVERPANKTPSTGKKNKNVPRVDSVSGPQPVIIRKTIIQRDTVIEHKQIIKKVPPAHEE